MIALQLILLTAGVSIELPAEAEAMGTTITLGEIATISCDDSQTLESLSSIELGYMPAPGYSRTLQRWKVEQAVAITLPDVEVKWTGQAACRISPAVEMVAAATIYEAARAAVGDLFERQEVTIQATGTIDDVSVPRGVAGAVLRADVLSNAARPGAWSVPVRVLVDGEPYRTVWIGLNVEIFAELPVLLNAAPKGTQLSASMFELRRVRLTDASSQPPALGLLSNSIAVRAMPAGHIVTERDVERPLAVSAGGQVWIQVVHGHIRASILGSAKQSGRIGDVITVQIESTGKEIKATVTGREEVTRELKKAQ